MKASELMIADLMIGDWVNFLVDVVGGETEHTPSVNEYQPMRIDSIYAFGGVESELGVTNDVSQLQPIPLTAEILEKNFEPLDMEGENFGFYDEYFEVEVSEYTDGLWQVVVDEIEMGDLPTWRMFVSNVNELQHALRLCGIEKNIEL